VRAPEHLAGWRVVARPDALDALVGAGLGPTLRLAPDDLLLVGVAAAPVVADADAIVVPDAGFVAWDLDGDELDDLIERHVEWELPTARPAVAQGLIASVPAKVWLHEDGTAQLVCLAAYADELAERVG
jgi:hypothetical protein